MKNSLISTPTDLKKYNCQKFFQICRDHSNPYIFDISGALFTLKIQHEHIQTQNSQRCQQIILYLGYEVAYIKANVQRILIHINCRKLQEAILADDNRMMHRQIIRMLNIKYANLHFDSLFWTRQMPYKE